MLSINIAEVTGPVPPGTGVIAPAFSFTASKSTHLDPEEVSKNLHLDKKKGYSNTAQELVELANSVIHPKAIYE
ncbi:unnamed protein product, partial [marine sediment metagenome]